MVSFVVPYGAVVCIIAAWFPAAHLVGEGYDDYAPVAEALVDVLCFFLQGQPGLVDIYMF